MLPLALVLALLAVAAAPAGAAAAEARLLACEEGAAVFEGRMAARRPVRMHMKFSLQVADPRRPAWTDVGAPGWGGWTRAPATARGYVYTRRVEGLTAPARYRAVVRFRWLDEAGEVRLRERRASPACRQDRDPTALHWRA